MIGNVLQILASVHLIEYMKENHAAWLSAYLKDLEDPYNTLMRLCQRFAHRCVSAGVKMW